MGSCPSIKWRAFSLQILLSYHQTKYSSASPGKTSARFADSRLPLSGRAVRGEEPSSVVLGERLDRWREDSDGPRHGRFEPKAVIGDADVTLDALTKSAGRERA